MATTSPQAADMDEDAAFEEVGPYVRNFVMTWNNYPEDWQARLTDFAESSCKYFIAKPEIGVENQTPHIQGYVELLRQKRSGPIQRRFGFWMYRRKGTQEQAIKYVEKPETSDGPIVRWGTKSKQGQRSDLQAVAEAISNGTSAYDAALEWPAQYVRYGAGFHRLQLAVDRVTSKKHRKVFVEYIWGVPGTGKTRGVLYDEDGEPLPDVYKWLCQWDKPWFDMYNGESTIVIDEFSVVNLNRPLWLAITEGHQLMLGTKGNHVFAKWTKVQITSNEDPEILFGRITGSRRRIHQVTQMGLNGLKRVYKP